MAKVNTHVGDGTEQGGGSLNKSIHTQHEGIRISVKPEVFQYRCMRKMVKKPRGGSYKGSVWQGRKKGVRHSILNVLSQSNEDIAASHNRERKSGNEDSIR